MAAKRKSLLAAVVCATATATATAALAGCSTDGDIRAKSGSEEMKKAPPAAAKATADPLAGLTADQIAEKAVAATKAARSVRMTGQIKSDEMLMSVDLAVDNRNTCTGKLGIEGGRAELRQVDKAMYMKADEKFWHASLAQNGSAVPGGDSAVNLLKGRWIKMPAGSAKDMGGICDLKAMLAEMDRTKSDRKGMAKGPDAEVAGRPATTLVKKEADETTTLYVAKEGEPYLLKVVKTGGDEPGTMVFTDYNKPVKAVAPPAGEVVDLGNPAAGPDAGGGTDSDTDSETGTGPDTGIDPDSDVGSDVGPDTGPETGTDPDAGADTGIDPDAGADTGPDTGIDPDSDTDPGTEADTGTDPGTDTGTGPGTDTGTGS